MNKFNMQHEQEWLKDQSVSVWLYRVDVILNCEDCTDTIDNAFIAMGEIYRLMDESRYTGIF